MSFNTNEVAVAISGAVTKVSSDVIITSASTSLEATGNVNYGFLTEDGVTISKDSNTNDIMAWQNSAIVRVSNTSSTAKYKFTLMQNTKASRELYYGSTEDVTTGKIAWNPAKMQKGRFVIDFIDSDFGDDGSVLIGRHVINKGQVTEVGDMVYKNGEAIGFEITLTAYANEDGVVAEVFHSKVTSGS